MQEVPLISQNLFQAPRVGAMRSYISDLINLTKPKILSLLLISTICPMVLAGGGSVRISDVLWALIGGALVSGSACALNCVLERDVDALMERTKNRPLAAGRLSPSTAVIFSLFLGLSGVIILTLFLNPLAASVAVFGHFFYVFVYTILLKRNTPQNIVIGGAAGAIPPLVGWAAVTGSIDLTAFLLFMVIFLWTPPHFWALALNKNEDYRRAGIPMLPVVAGVRVTCEQMFWYSISLIPVSFLLVYVNEFLGWFSFVVLGLLSIIFCYKNYQLRRLVTADVEPRTKKAWDVFGFSLIYLALFFVCLVVDSALL